VERRFRNAVAVDETVVKMHGLRAYVWSAVDVDSGKVLVIYASWSRSMIVVKSLSELSWIDALTN
jgi:transposase-like protein